LKATADESQMNARYPGFFEKLLSAFMRWIWSDCDLAEFFLVHQYAPDKLP